MLDTAGPSPLAGQNDYISVVHLYYSSIGCNFLSSSFNLLWGNDAFFCIWGLWVYLSQIYLEILGSSCLRSLMSGDKSQLLLDFNFLCFSMYSSACLQKCCQGLLNSLHFVLWCWYWWSITVTFLTSKPIAIQCQLTKTVKSNLRSKE